MSTSRGGKARRIAGIQKAEQDRYERLAALSVEAAADIRARLWSIHEDYGTHLYDLTTLVYSRLPAEPEDGSDRKLLEPPKPLTAEVLADLAESVRKNEHADHTGSL
jgi:hypothetical protein